MNFFNFCKKIVDNENWAEYSLYPLDSSPTYEQIKLLFKFNCYYDYTQLSVMNSEKVEFADNPDDIFNTFVELYYKARNDRGCTSFLIRIRDNVQKPMFIKEKEFLERIYGVSMYFYPEDVLTHTQPVSIEFNEVW